MWAGSKILNTQILFVCLMTLMSRGKTTENDKLMVASFSLFGSSLLLCSKIHGTKLLVAANNSGKVNLFCVT